MQAMKRRSSPFFLSCNPLFRLHGTLRFREKHSPLATTKWKTAKNAKIKSKGLFYLYSSETNWDSGVLCPVLLSPVTVSPFPGKVHRQGAPFVFRMGKRKPLFLSIFRGPGKQVGARYSGASFWEKRNSRCNTGQCRNAWRAEATLMTSAIYVMGALDVGPEIKCSGTSVWIFISMDWETSAAGENVESGLS